MKIIFNFELQRKSCHKKMAHLGNDGKRLSIDGENRYYHINYNFSNLHHPQFCIEDTFLKLKSGNLLANLQTSKRSSFSHNLNYAKKHERQGDGKRW